MKGNSKIKKNYFIYLGIFFLFLVLLIITGLFSINKTKPPAKIESTNKIEELEKKKITFADECKIFFPEIDNYKECIEYFAFTEKDLSICDKFLEGPMDLAHCKATVAVSNNDLIFCEEIEKGESQDIEFQRNICFMSFAIANQDEKVCDKISFLSASPSRDDCIKRVTSAKSSPKSTIYLGVSIVQLDKVLSVIRNLPVDYGALIIKKPEGSPAVRPGSPAEKAGLKEGDIILEIEGMRITKDFSLNKVLEACCKPGDKISMKILREGKEMIVKVILEKKSEN